MAESGATEVERSARGLALDPTVITALRFQLPVVAERTVAALTAEVAEYTGTLSGEMGANIEQAVQMALGTFLHLAAQSDDTDASSPLVPALEGAYALGRGEARSGRTMDALLAAYRVGARVAWRELSTTAVAGGLAAGVVAQFAELVFAYIDELSAASVAGHTDELATSGRVREQYRERLAQALLAGESAEQLSAGAQRADWEPPVTLTALLVPSALVRTTATGLDARTLSVSGDLAQPAAPDQTVLLVPDVSRRSLLRLLQGRAAVVGPTRPWTAADVSYRRALRGLELLDPSNDSPVDTDDHLVALVLGADREALDDLRAQALAPLAALREGTAERLAETLRSWLLHQGRREDVAADLVVHPQTVRYRMTQLRELYGDALQNPETVLALTLALAVPPRP